MTKNSFATAAVLTVMLLATGPTMAGNAGSDGSSGFGIGSSSRGIGRGPSAVQSSQTKLIGTFFTTSGGVKAGSGKCGCQASNGMHAGPI